MKCRKCGSVRMYGNGWKKARSVHTHIYRCYECGAQCSDEKRPVQGYVPLTPSEHSRRVSMGLLRYYKEAPAEMVAAHKKAVQDGLARRRASAPPSGERGLYRHAGRH